jgi:hypothetical protein
VTGGIGILVGIVLLVFCRDSPEAAGFPPVELPEKKILKQANSTVRTRFCSRSVLLLVAAYKCMNLHADLETRSLFTNRADGGRGGEPSSHHIKRSRRFSLFAVFV